MTHGNLTEGGRSHGGMTTQQNDYNTGQPGARLILRISGTVSNVTSRKETDMSTSNAPRTAPGQHHSPQPRRTAGGLPPAWGRSSGD